MADPCTTGYSDPWEYLCEKDAIRLELHLFEKEEIPLRDVASEFTADNKNSARCYRYFMYIY